VSLLKKAFFRGDSNPGFIFCFFLAIVIATLLLFGIPGCSADSTKNTSPDTKNSSSGTKEPIRIGINVWAGFAYAFVAADKGFFKNNGVDVELVLSREYTQSLDLYENGDTDGFFGVFADVVIHKSHGDKIRTIYVVDYSDSADVIIADPLYDSIEKLKGKKIGIESINSFSHMFVLQVFQKAGIPETDIQFEVVPSQDITEALDDGRIQAGHTWDPEKTEALNKGYKIVATAGDVPGLITDVLAVNDSLVKERPSDVLAMVKSISQAKDFLDTNPQEALKIMIKYEGGTIEEIAAAIKEMYLLDLQDNLESMEPSKETTSLYGAGAIISEYYMKRGQISEIPVFDEIIDPTFIKKVLGNN
jgi:NitT/TauT family transport system substrate-binding protein